jgi:type IV pilus assembly protein PilC
MLKNVKVVNISTGAVSNQLVDTDNEEKAIIGCGLASNETATVETITGIDESIRRLTSPKPSVEDRAQFFGGLARCLDRNIGIVKGLQLQSNRVRSARYKGAIGDLVSAISSGEKLSEAMARHPDLFPDQILSLIIAGEEAGQLSKVCRRIGTAQRKANKIIKKLKSGMIYPAIVLLLCVAVVIVMSFTLVPAMGKLFLSFKAELPMGTKALMFLSNVLIKQPYLAILPFVAMYIFFVNWPRISMVPMVQDMLLKVPKIGDIIRKSASAVSFRTLAMLTDANVRLSSALNITADATWHYHYKTFFRNLAEHVGVGRNMHEGFLLESHWLGPDARNICGLIELSAETGSGTELLNEIADDYEDELDALAAQIDKIMEPITMIFMGVMVGFLIYAIYGPVFSLGDVLLGKKK